MARNAIVIFYTFDMPGRSNKLTPADEKKIVAAVRSGVPVAVLAKQFGVTRPTVYRAIRRFHDKASVVQVGTAPVSFTIDRAELHAFDAFIGRLGLKSRADALRRVCRVPAGFLEPDPYLAEAIHDLRNELSAIGRNVNQLVAAKNYELRRGQKLKISKDQQQLLADLLENIEGMSVTVRELQGRRAANTVTRFVANMTGADDATS